MCASFQARFNVTQLVKVFADARAPLLFEGGLPNIEPVDEVRPTDPARAVRALAGDQAELAQMRFGFPPPAPKRPPVINFRSEGRRFSNGPNGGRCLVPVSGFYEFTGDKYPKTRWLLSGVDQPFLALAAIWRAGADGAPDAFSLLTAEPGPDVAPYHDRGVLPLAPDLWADWLFDRRPAEELLAPPPAGVLKAEAAPRP
ncbi:SOS response-associated peptidase family protein [Brevundimonas lenta]|uniref:Abasic site processing protein n=1 Tax=Brevundimonas lenta TaxID=424796 RepID=A0A7W6JAU8_9CAUL|nr:SOS response-associated peptidase family protein [Brevundimonas lenta]MBB4081704.1 putative SOS response-associated peptidase YedK [Brevundimonas lenta]